MKPIEFNPDFLDDLVARRVAVFVGAGVSSSAKFKDGSCMPTWGGYLKTFAAKIKAPQLKQEVQDLLKKNDLLTACDLLKSHFSEGWSDAMRESFGKKPQSARVHELLIKLGQRLYLTTNFDKILEDALLSFRKSDGKYPKVENSITEATFGAFRDNLDYVIKLHGDVDSPETIIFSRSEYAEKAFSSELYQRFFETVLTTHTVLFVGFSLADPAIGQLLDMHASKLPRSRPHYAVLAGDYSSNYRESLKRTRKVYILTYKHTTNHANLPKLLEELNDARNKRARVLRLNLDK